MAAARVAIASASAAAPQTFDGERQTLPDGGDDQQRHDHPTANQYP